MILENQSTSSRPSSAIMISFHMVECAFESVYIALSIAHLTSVKDIMVAALGQLEVDCFSGSDTAKISKS